MRKKTAVAVGLATLLVASLASAAGGKNDGGGKGGGGGGGGGGSSAGGGGFGGSFTGGGSQKDTSTGAGYGDEAGPKKKWEVSAYFETHRLVRQNDLGGDAVNKQFNFFYVYPHYDITKYDRVRIRAGFYERFTADQGETGLRFDDVVFSYTRYIPLPAEFLLGITGWVTAPTSFSSKKAGIVTVPRLALRLDKSFGRFSTKLIAYDEYYVVKYRTAEGGNYNPQWHWATLLEGEFRIPEIEKLFIGADVATGWTSYYGVDSGNAGASTGTGPSADTQFSHQPITQTYGAEIFARYELPKWEGLSSDVTLTYGEGDPTLGYTSVLHDGARHMYFGFNRHVSEVYLSLSARY